MDLPCNSLGNGNGNVRNRGREEKRKLITGVEVEQQIQGSSRALRKFRLGNVSRFKDS